MDASSVETEWTGAQGKEWIGILNRIVREGITVQEVRKRCVDIWGEMFSAKGTAAIRVTVTAVSEEQQGSQWLTCSD